MKKLILKLTLFVPLLAGVVLVNYYVDPACLFKDDAYLFGIADLLLRGDNVQNVPNLDERLLQKHYIERLTYANDVIVLGSSRSMLIGKDLFPGKRFFNNSVSGASIEDFVAIYNMYEEKGMPPGSVVLGIDPWIFIEHSGQTRWRSVRPDVYAGFKRMGVSFSGNNIDLVSKKYLQLVSFPYFQSSLETLFLRRFAGRRAQYFPTQERVDPVDMILLADGSRSYPQKERSKTAAQVLAAAQGLINDHFGLRSHVKIDERDARVFELFVRRLRSRNTEITIFLPPYNPFIHDYCARSDEYRIMRDVEAFIRRFADKEHISVRGSYDPHAYSLTQDDFYDGVHPTVETTKAVFSGSLDVNPRGPRGTSGDR